MKMIPKQTSLIFMALTFSWATISPTQDIENRNIKTHFIKIIKTYAQATKEKTVNFVRCFLGQKPYTREEIQIVRAKTTSVVIAIVLLSAGIWYLKKPKNDSPPENQGQSKNPTPVIDNTKPNTSSKDEENSETESDGYVTAPEAPSDHENILKNNAPQEQETNAYQKKKDQPPSKLSKSLSDLGSLLVNWFYPPPEIDNEIPEKHDPSRNDGGGLPKAESTGNLQPGGSIN